MHRYLGPERVARLGRQPGSSLSRLQIRQALLTSRTDQTMLTWEMAEVLVLRYCSVTVHQFDLIGRRLGITPQYARTICDRGLKKLGEAGAQAMLVRAGMQQGSRLWTAINQRQLSRASRYQIPT